MAQLSIVKPKTAIEKRTRTTVDTIMITPERMAKWKMPSGQRPLRENQKVKDAATKIQEDVGVIPGILTIGIFEDTYWIIDGQHRLHAFKLTALKEGYADVRFLHAESMADINAEFVELNSRLVAMRPDDFLRGLEGTTPALARIRQECTFVGYDQIRRGTSGPILSMSIALRSWSGSSGETPVSYSGNMLGGTVGIAQTITEDEVSHLIGFLHISHEAYGADPQYGRLWGAINLVLTMWMYRRLVLGEGISPQMRSVKLTKEQFKKCLMSVSAAGEYQDWLLGRHMGERDRSPAYSRLRAIFMKRMLEETGKKVQFPQPDWWSRS